MKQQLKEIKDEVQVLQRTRAILESRADDMDQFMQDLEAKKGISGYSKIEEQIQGVSNQKEMLDNEKGATLQEITQMVNQIQAEVRDRKKLLAPEIQNLKVLRQQLQDIENTYQDQKRQYDSVVGTLDQDKKNIDKDVKEVFDSYKHNERQFHQNNIQTEIYDAFLKRIGNEAKFLSQPDKKLTNEYKSYQEFFRAKLVQQEGIVKDLRNHQKHIKDNSENFSAQMSMFKNLKALLAVKAKAAKDGDDQGMIGYQDSNAQGFDRFVVRD